MPKQRWIAYHVVFGWAGFAKCSLLGVWRWFPTKYSTCGVPVDEVDLIFAPKHVTEQGEW